MNHLIGRQAILEVSDPWEFGSEHGAGPFAASIDTASPQGLILKLASPLTYKGLIFRSVVATARHDDKPLDTITDHGFTPVNLTPIPLHQDTSPEDAFGAAAQWRGWHLIGGIRRR